MKYYAGLDVSMESTSICVEDEAGTRVLERVVCSEIEAIAAALSEFKADLEVIGLETGCISAWLTKGLQKEGLPVKCIDARVMAGILSTLRNKTDKNDARAIAKAMRCENYREVHTKSDEAQQRKVLIGSRAMLVKSKTQLTNTIRGQLKSYGIRLALGNGGAFFDGLRKALPKLCPEIQQGITALLSVYDELVEQLKLLTRSIESQVRRSPEATLLITIPGVGPIVAMTFIAEIDDPKRFKNSRAVGAYIGMTPKQYQSGEVSRSGGISKRGPSYLRKLLLEAAIVVLTRTNSWSRLKAWGQKLARKKGLKKAAMAVARKLAIVMHRMLITGQPFIYGEQKEKSLVPA